MNSIRLSARRTTWLRAAVLLTVLVLLGALPAAAQGSRDWWHDAVFYELFVRSFYDSNGDGIGDFNGITEKMDYLNDGDPATTDDLGVTALWLMPIFDSPSYHGYDVNEYYLVNDQYGTMEDFQRMLEAAHQRGIRVILDLPFNHTSSEHPWFLASAKFDNPFTDWYIWSDDDPGYRGPWNQGVWHPLNGRFFYGVFWEGMPDLNYTNPAVTAQMDNIARFWLDKGVDGFRLDGAKYVIEEGTKQQDTPSTLAWLTAFEQFVQSVKPDAMTVGEIWDNDYTIKPYIAANSVDIAFEFDLATAMLQSAEGGNSAAVRTLQDRADGIYPDARYGRFLSNHDQTRTMDMLRSDTDKAKVAASLLLTGPGVPFIYYGEEIGMNGMKPDERLRTPMQWDANRVTGGFTDGTPWETVQSNTPAVNVAMQTDDPESLLNTYRDLIHLRLAHSALRHGDILLVESDSRAVYSFIRRSEDETLLVLTNLSGEAVTDYRLSLNEGLSGASAASLVYGEGTVFAPTLTDAGGFEGYSPLASLPPYSTTILALTGG